MSWNENVPQSDTTRRRHGRFNGESKRSNALTELEIRAYYKAVLGEQRVPDSQTLLIMYTCPFARHTDGFTVNLATGSWRCQGGCGEGDVFAFEMI